MSYHNKRYSEWLQERTSVEDTETEGSDLKDDIELEDEQDEYITKEINKCPRCGEHIPCDCQQKDSMDMNTSVRFKGKTKTK